MTETPCRCCHAVALRFGQARLLGRHDVAYFRCTTCGFIQPEEPHWLGEAYAEAIAATDLGLVRRNLLQAPVVRAVLRACFNPAGHFVDYGGGYGLLVRMLRDDGYDFLRHDPMCRNLFAQGFDAAPGEQAELVTAFEVFEHLVDPPAELEKMLTFSRSILFSTLLVPDPAPQPGDWWYYCLETGQHVALYTAEALRRLGARHGLRLLTDGRSLHLLPDRPVNAALFRLASRQRLAHAVAAFTRRPSLLLPDVAHIRTTLPRA